MNYVKHIRRSMDWILNNSKEGYIFISDKQKKPYPEVTGYLIPTLRKMGFHDISKSFAEYLVGIQNEDGGWGLKNKSFIFDTSQIIEGLSDLGGFSDNIDKAVRFIEKNISDNRFVDMYNGKISDHIYPRVLWCLKKIGYDTSVLEKEYCVESNRRFNCLSHFYGYSFEGHARLGYDCSDFIQVIKNKKFILPEKPGMNSICFAGLSQISLSLFLCGEFDMGMNILEKVTSFQNNSGGFYGSNGKYFMDEEISWAVKFYLDACFEASELWFKNNKHIFKDKFEGGKNDSRLEFINSNIKIDDIVLEIGCGKGRYINNIECQEKYASDIVDIEDLKNLKDVNFIKGSCLNIPFIDNFFDKVVCAESLEHTVFHNNAIQEMMRVIKPGGELLIIDKDGSKGQPKKILFSEEWPNFDEILRHYKYEKVKLNFYNNKMPFVGVKIYV